MRWPDNEQPAWHMDNLLAQEVCAPVIQRYRPNIKLWRFHRRAARDNAGHQFSLIFYTDAATATRINRAIEASSLLTRLSRAGLIAHVSYDDRSAVTKPNIEDTSDPSWSAAVKRAWPKFIMGASEMWLELIDDAQRQAAASKQPTSIADWQALYRGVNDVVGRVWREQGGHALLHHLNALFGYEPTTIYERREMSF